MIVFKFCNLKKINKIYKYWTNEPQGVGEVDLREINVRHLGEIKSYYFLPSVRGHTYTKLAITEFFD